LISRERETGSDVFVRQSRKIPENFIFSHVRSKILQNIVNGDA
jgi:hypothetical protein